MNSAACFRALLAPVLGFSVLLTGCDDGEDNDGDDGLSAGEGVEAGNDTNTEPAPVGDVINQNFDAWEDNEGFFTAKPDQQELPSTFDDHNTAQVIGDQTAIAIHHNAADNSGFGWSVEVQFALDRQTDMSGEDYRIAFDLYIPSTPTGMLGASAQWAFYETANYTPIYSQWITDIPLDAWHHYEGPVDLTNVSHSGFPEESNPSAWIFDAVRIQVIVDGEGAAEGSEILYYIDNLVVTNAPPA